jgi:hypothetical protein
MVVAIVLVGLIGVALAALTEQTGADLRRVRIQTASAQARQILIAATHLLATNPDKAIILPSSLLETGATLKITPVTHQPNRIILRLDVICEKIHLSEFLTLSPQGSSWNITDAQLQ